MSCRELILDTLTSGKIWASTQKCHTRLILGRYNYILLKRHDHYNIMIKYSGSVIVCRFADILSYFQVDKTLISDFSVLKTASSPGECVAVDLFILGPQIWGYRRMGRVDLPLPYKYFTSKGEKIT